MGLLNVPDEVLDIVLKLLLPPFRSQSLAETYVFTVPVDLLAARLVCRRFHRVATPFAWRRAQLQIASPASKHYGNADGGPLTANKHCLRSLARCRFFDENPQLAAHVRVLLVSLEWHAERPERARDALRAATRAMSALRTVLVWDTDVLPFNDIRALFQRPLLRAVRLMDVDGSAFPVQGGWGAGLKMLHISNSICPARLVASAASTLECVSIELAPPCPVTQPAPTLEDMPWETLREVALVDCGDSANEEDWSSFFAGFEHHKLSSHPTALSELVIGDLGGLESSRVSQLLSTFGGHPLRRLSLYHVLILDLPVLTSIVSAFPTLSHLTLLTESGLVAWPGALDVYAQKLAGLAHLVSLTWNNFALDSETDAVFPRLSEGALGILYAKHANTLARRVRTLRCVKLLSMTDGTVDTVWVRSPKKDRRIVEVARSAETVALHTSSWGTTSGAFEDI